MNPAAPTPVLSVLVPAFNEAETIGPFLARLIPALEALGRSFEILLIDDGSTDGTWARWLLASQSDPRLRGLKFSRNFGKEIAIAAGLDHARGEAVVLIDADLQHPPEVIAAFVREWENGYDVVYGVRQDRVTDSPLRKNLTHLFYKLFRTFGAIPLPEGAGDFRLMDRRVVKALRQLGERARFSKGLYAWVGFEAKGVPFIVAERAAGESKFSFRKLFRFAFDGITSFSTLPLQLWTHAGILISVPALATAIFFLVRTMTSGTDVPGYASLIVSVMFFSGVQLISLGVIGGYVGRIFAEVKRRPLYIVAEESGPDADPTPAQERLMFRAIASVSSLTALSRITGFARDIVIAATLGNGMMADAFVVAQRLPNHFRAIFGEGAFNNAFVPTYAGTLEKRDTPRAQIFAGGVLTLMALVTGLSSILAIIFMPLMVDLLAPGFRDDPAKFELTVALTRIAFPYLFFIVLVTLLSGILNAHKRFATAAFAPVLLNLSVIAALAISYLFPNAAYAAAFGVLAAGLLEFLLVALDAKLHGIFPRPSKINFDAETKLFLKTLGPAIIGSAGVQIAMFADTIIASMLPTGAVASLYYADRLYQLPVGMIGLAAGTVLLPTMSKHVAAGRFIEAHHQQNRAILLTLALSMPFFVGFLTIPAEIMKALFARGAFTDAAAREAGAVLAAYGTGLLVIVLIRPAVAGFYARNDTATPLIASFSGIGVNVVLKILLFRSEGAPGLAFATATGAWVNLILLVLMAHRRIWMDFDTDLARGIAVMAVAALPLGALFLFGIPSANALVQTLPTLWQAPAALAVIGVAGALVYFSLLAGGVKLLRVRLR